MDGQSERAERMDRRTEIDGRSERTKRIDRRTECTDVHETNAWTERMDGANGWTEQVGGCAWYEHVRTDRRSERTDDANGRMHTDAHETNGWTERMDE